MSDTTEIERLKSKLDDAARRLQEIESEARVCLRLKRSEDHYMSSLLAIQGWASRGYRDATNA